MKKLIALLLVLTMALSMAACGSKNDETTQGNKPTEGSQPTQGSQPTEGNEPSQPVSGDVTPDVDAATWGGELWAAFEAAQAANPSATAEEIAAALAADPSIPFFPMSMAVEPGYLAGFDNEVKGFEKGAMFGPMIGSIAFVGYVFDLAEGADVAAFINGLLADCNLRWNVCVAADQAVAGSKGNRVFFVMCPTTHGEPDEGNGSTEAEVIEPNAAEGTLGATLWNAFLGIAADMAGSTADEMAFWLVQEPEISGFMNMPVEEGLLSGFDNYEVKGFENGAIFAPMIGSIPFVGYIFNLAEGADVNAFINELSANCNPRWNICVEADQTVIGAYGNTVFFLMCPSEA